MGVDKVGGPQDYAKWTFPDKAIPEAKKSSGDTDKESHSEEEADRARRQERQANWQEAQKRAESAQEKYPQVQADRVAEQKAKQAALGQTAEAVSVRYGGGVTRSQLESKLPAEQTKKDRWGAFGEPSKEVGEPVEGVREANNLIAKMQDAEVPFLKNFAIKNAREVKTPKEAKATLKKLSTFIGDFPDSRINHLKTEADTVLASLEQ